MGFVQVCFTLAFVTAGCVFFLITDGDADCSGDGNASGDCSIMQWSLVDVNHVSESNELILSSVALLGFRRICLYTVVATVLYVVLDPDGLVITVPARPPAISTTVHLKHLSRITTFTVWSWILIGLYFGLTLYITHCNDRQNREPPVWVLHLTWVLYEVSFSIALLITVLVTFVLIPAAKHRGLPVVTFFNTPALLMHNANVVFMLLESACNRLPILLPHIVFGVLYGVLYVVFAWLWFWYKGVFYYFFLDYQHPHAVLLHLGLIMALGVFFYFGVVISWLTEGDSLHALLGIATLCPLILKIRDT